MGQMSHTRQLRDVVRVVEAGNSTATSRRLGVARPALGRQSGKFDELTVWTMHGTRVAMLVSRAGQDPRVPSVPAMPSAKRTDR